ncbi:quercetin dioxygenase-like cupin family protein [Symbiobacterium terraclitae]|jgi:quercetin dioxygenase-like cupin family protein|uniref:Quercetin dioxygenase-like cupin family protein n=1 Tax=Symbiobacterium terraclitae TaxID=557451 RepID=A0ABS4JND7_9FIRM|nr:hypothetical protein [Symbiobacterium terraclitae]MBP2017051.1 quercetin dioxygenase-like cupin family protein [Symbiobacterium terraclitae]
MQVQLTRTQEPAAGQVSTEIIHSCQDMRVVLVRLSPGSGLPASSSSSSVSLQVLKGRCEMLSGCEWAPSEAGTIWFYPPGEPYAARATDEPATLLVTFAPRP